MLRRRPADNRRIGAIRPECATVRHRLLDFLDGDLDGATRQVVQTHLDNCADCRREWEQQRQAEHALQTALLHVPPAGDLRAGFYARLAVQTPEYRPPFWIVARRSMPTLALGAVAMMLVISLFPASISDWTAPKVSIVPAPIDPAPPLLYTLSERPTGKGAIAQTGTERPASGKRAAANSLMVASAASPVGERHRLSAKELTKRIDNLPVVRVPPIADSRVADHPLAIAAVSDIKPAGTIAMDLASASAGTEAHMAGSRDTYDTDDLAKSRDTMSVAARSYNNIRSVLTSGGVELGTVDPQGREVGYIQIPPDNGSTIGIHDDTETSGDATPKQMP